MKRNKRDKLLELGVHLYLTGWLVEQLRSQMENMVELGYTLFSEEMLRVNQTFNIESFRFLDLISQYERLDKGSDL